MTITREQVADLQPGDVVRVTGWQGLTVEGPLSESTHSDTLWLGDYLRLTHDIPSRPVWMEGEASTLTVVSRALRPLYVNHPRTEPVPGDVVCSVETQNKNRWMYCDDKTWADSSGSWVYRDQIPKRLRLLVDGETGQVVP